MKIKLFVVATLLALLSACVPNPVVINNQTECLQPLYSVAFPIIPSSEDNKVPQRQIPPKGEWQEYDALPFDGFLREIRPKRHELWFIVRSESEYRLYQYFIDTKQWKSYEWDSGFYPIWISSDDAVWSGGKLFLDGQNVEGFHPLLGRFNDDLGHFEYGINVSGFLQEVPQYRPVSHIVEDPSSGMVWFFTEADKATLVSLNPKTGQSEEHYSFDGRAGAMSISIAPDGSVWFVDRSNDQLIRYIPTSHEVQSYEFPNSEHTGKLPLNFDRASYISTDRSGRVWLGNYGWLELSDNNSPVWYRVIESPVLVTEVGLPLSQYGLSHQLSVYQSSDSRYWFTGGAGVVRFDLEQGSWCLITTGESKVVEDDDHNLWIAVYGHLYKYSLKP